MWCRLLVAVVAVACNDAVSLVVDSDRPVPEAIDSLCVGVADVDASGGTFGRVYPVASLPQSLRLEPGNAEAAWAWVRGDRGGVPVIRAGHRVDFTEDVTLGLARCPRGSSAAPALVGDPVGPPTPRLVVSNGANGQVVVAIGATVSVIDAVDGALVSTDAPAPPPGTVVAAIAADVDGDCDDDLVIATSGGPPVIWLRTATSFTVATTLGDAAVAALGAADVDGDGDLDLVTGGGDTLALWRNDGSGTYTIDATALSGNGRVSSISALALGDLDGDGSSDLVVGQAGDPLVAWLGGGSFTASDAIIPPVPLAVTHLELADLDGDFDPDLAVAVAGAPLRLYIDREGRLEDQTFARFTPPIPTAAAIAIGGWDNGCEPDLVIAGEATSSLRGTPAGTLEMDGSGPTATDVVMVDLDDDGDLDAVIATPEGARWLAR